MMTLTFALGLAIGLFVGACVGMFACAIGFAGCDDDDMPVVTK